ncbi:hypothetical protein [Acetobacter malorum]|nr:hypothetical protein [Acetobacter malorum]
MHDDNSYRQAMAYWDEKISTILKAHRADHKVQHIMDCYRQAVGEDQACFVAALAGQLVIAKQRDSSSRRVITLQGDS